MKKLILSSLVLVGSTSLTFGQEYPEATPIIKPESVKRPKSEPVRVPESFPKYKGGMQALAKFIKKNTEYPEEAVKKRITGKVFVEFLIMANGKVDPKSIKVLRGVHELLDKEAVRLILLTKWIPAKLDGKKVPFYYTVPINFHIDD